MRVGWLLFFAACSSSNDKPIDASVATDAADGSDECACYDAGKLPAAFNPGPYGTNPKDIAGPFEIPTTDGPWDFQKEWTGADSYVFLFFEPGVVVYPNGTDYSADLFKQSLGSLLSKSPPNVHYFFMPLSTNDAAWPAARDKWVAQLAQIGGDWATRVHFSDTGARDLPNWIGMMMQYRIKTMLPYKQYDTMGFAIDRFQRIREVGMLGTLVQNGIQTRLPFLAYEPTYYEFEWSREQSLQAENATNVKLIDDKTVYDTQDIDATLPDPSTFDTLEVDLAMNCDNHRDGECGAWDYLSYLWVCTPSMSDGGDPWKCDTEIARWITSYWRETRWVTDISQMLPLLKSGAVHLRWNASGQWDPRKTNYHVTLSFRYANKNKGMKPVSAVPLWTGGTWDATYDMKHPLKQVAVANGAKKVELYTLITGHGASNGNCAEFCNHEHHFTINGAAHVRTFPGAQSALGCADNVGKGAVPNQHGTWYFGRGGWCPGFDVSPWVVDVTSEAKLGQMNDLGYTTTFGGQPVDTNRGNIVLTTYLVTWQ